MLAPRLTTSLQNLVRPCGPARRNMVRFLLAALLGITLLGLSTHAFASELGSLSASLQSFQADPTSKNSGMVFGLFMGIILTAATYLFFIWVVMHDRGQIFLLCFLLCLAVYMAVTNKSLVGQLGFVGGVDHILAAYSLLLACFFSTHAYPVRTEPAAAPDASAV